ncbi:hypothetical protein [Nocardia sp. GTS18]|uniref:hypothetical protein n=1 Tax=Nocardia sp. GTS18 TaxID=1778064 RepID=UPI0015EEE342|nr:hypothetical protein [Nocardia sp. GTS18]
MSASHQIFIRANRSLSNIISDINWATGISLTGTGNSEFPYAAKLDSAFIDIEPTHDYENEPGLPFEQYSTILEVRDIDNNQKREEALSRDIFGKLAALPGYHLMLVFNLQRNLMQS